MPAQRFRPARRARTIQAEVRDATARLLADDVVLVAHNARFDVGFLTQALGTRGLLDRGARVPRVCTMEWARHFMTTPSRRLTTCCEVAGVEIGRHHNALDDALADRDVDRDDARVLVVDDRVDRDRRLAGLTVADDQLALATADRHQRVDRLGREALVHVALEAACLEQVVGDRRDVLGPVAQRGWVRRRSWVARGVSCRRDTRRATLEGVRRGNRGAHRLRPRR